MKKIAIAFIAAGFVLGMSGVAAADNGEPDIQFVDVEALIVDGEFRLPSIYDYRARRAAQFDTLHQMDTSFIAKITESAAAVK